jgi:hypothetical protein
MKNSLEVLMNSDDTFKVNGYKFDWSSDTQTMHVGFSAQEIDDLLKTDMSSTIGAQGSNYTISAGAGANGTWGYSTTNASIFSSSDKSLHVTGDAEIEGDLTIGGVSIKETLDAINKRLAILQPDPAKLEHFEALRKAYEHYKTLEALCQLPIKKEEQ